MIFCQTISRPLNCKHVFYRGLQCYHPIKRFIRTCFLITSQSAPSCFTVHALVDRSQSISTHNSVLARLKRLFPRPPSTFISHFQGSPFLGVALYIGAYVLSACFVTSCRHVFSKKNIFKVVVNKWFWG